MDIQKVSSVLDKWFVFQEWSAYSPQPRTFTDTVDGYAFIKIYDDFKEFLKENDHYLEDSEGEGDALVEVVLSDKEKFKEFLEHRLNLSSFYEIRYEDVQEPFIYGTCNGVIEPKDYFQPIKNVSNENDVILFINEVLSDIGQVTTPRGLRNQYEVLEIEDR